LSSEGKRGESERHTSIHIYIHTYRQTDRQTHTHTYADRDIERQAGRQAGRGNEDSQRAGWRDRVTEKNRQTGRRKEECKTGHAGWQRTKSQRESE